MKHLWTYIDQKSWSEKKKYYMTILILSVLSALAGFAGWLIIRNFAFDSLDAMLCFIGYPVILSWFLVFFYSCRHDYHTNIN